MVPSTYINFTQLTLGLKKCKQDAYRRELDQQIEEKKKQQLAEKESERRECEMWSQQETKQRKNLMKSIEKKFCERIHSENVYAC